MIDNTTKNPFTYFDSLKKIEIYAFYLDSGYFSVLRYFHSYIFII